MLVKTPITIVIAITLALTGCANRAPSSYNTYSQPSFNPGNHLHRYKVTVVDAKGVPMSGAAVEWELTADSIIGIEKRSDTTGADGVGIASLSVPPKFSTAIKWADFKSTAKYKVSVTGYATKSGEMSNSSYVSSSSSSQPTDRSEKVTLVRPIDYLSDDFANSKQFSQLRTKVLDFLALIRLQSLLHQADLKLGAIKMQDFKGRRYLVIELRSDNVYNSLKLDRYAVGKQVFDETVRKMLNPLNEKISDARLFYGYNIIVNTTTKSFTEKYAVGDPMKYEFLMPQNSVRSYKDKDISGQKLIDDSIVLLNDERIDLKFQ